MDYQKFINLSIGKAEMSQCINERRKLKNFLEPYFQLRLENLVLNDHGIQIADDHGIKYDTDGAITIKELKKFCYEIGYMKVDFEKSSEEFFELRTQLHDRSVWKDGSESHTFNKLEDIVLNFNPKTPVLGKCIFREFNFTKIFVKNDLYLFLFQAVPFPKLWNPIKLEMISYLVESIG